MVYLDSVKIMECVELETVSKDRVTLKIDGEQLLNAIYEDIKIELKDNDGPIQGLTFQDAPFVEIYPNDLFDEKNCRQLAIEIKNRLNSEIKTKLNLK